MSTELTITSTVITSIITFLVLHFIIEPRKEKRRKREEKLKNLYAPLYTKLVTKLIEVPEAWRDQDADMILIKERELKQVKEKDQFVQFVLNNSRYASVELLEEIHKFVERVERERHFPTHNHFISVDELVKVVVREYNKLKKGLGEDWDEKELNYGVPTFIEQSIKQSIKK
ncbi:hypothetical protein [Bacillus cereus group sp. BfR-BA-01380]|uniref:hypothetical protein n=1 Tax=Bacillus cereus group sp. BfR-BA-01380 TaxID=2920324 RepID=UPI001F59E255|nr:hypothetical protein [Bacillus cereus group sp. BfR-BA-01380]